MNSTAHSFSRGNTVLASCAFDASSYSNPDMQLQKLGRELLKTWGAVILIPRAPLTSGTNYTVSITANEKDYEWSFTIE